MEWYKITLTVLIVSGGLINAYMAYKDNNGHSMIGWLSVAVLGLFYFV